MSSVIGLTVRGYKEGGQSVLSGNFKVFYGCWVGCGSGGRSAFE